MVDLNVPCLCPCPCCCNSPLSLLLQLRSRFCLAVLQWFPPLSSCLLFPPPLVVLSTGSLFLLEITSCFSIWVVGESRSASSSRSQQRLQSSSHASGIELKMVPFISSSLQEASSPGALGNPGSTVMSQCWRSETNS